MAGPDTLYTTIINTEEAEGAVGEGEAAEFCPPTSARNLGWRPTRGGQVMIQPCPNGATGLARYYTVLYYTVLYCTVLYCTVASPGGAATAARTRPPPRPGPRRSRT